MSESSQQSYFEMTDKNYERPAQIPIRKSRLNYLINEYAPKESDRWILINHQNHFVIYDKETKLCIYDAEYIDLDDQSEDPVSICVVITKIRINIDPIQHPKDIEDDFGTVADLVEKEL